MCFTINVTKIRQIFCKQRSNIGRLRLKKSKKITKQNLNK